MAYFTEHVRFDPDQLIASANNVLHAFGEKLKKRSLRREVKNTKPKAKTQKESPPQVSAAIREDDSATISSPLLDPTVQARRQQLWKEIDELTASLS